MKNKRLVLLFPEIWNNNYLRDTCIIPYVLAKYYDYDAKLVFVRQENDYSNFSKLPELKLEILEDEKYIKSYIKENARSIDVFMAYFLSPKYSLRWIKLYKKYNPRGLSFLKTDMNMRQALQLQRKDLKNIVRTRVIKYQLKDVDILSTEISTVQNILRVALGKEVFLFPNGILLSEEDRKPVKKERYIMTVGKLGTEVKNSYLLVDAYCDSDVWKYYKLYLVGTYTEDFKKYIEKKKSHFPEIEGRIILMGPIFDEDERNELYKKCSVFVLPSRSEGFSLALVEAASFGDFLVSTNQVAALKDVSNNYKFGESFDCESEKQLVSIFNGIEKRMKEFSGEELVEYAKKYDWRKIGGDIAAAIENAKK